ncbi:MAG: hypothetical protein JWM93_1610 [Frankiales bacterium]|nr:hypothetical protein [Frankiales bacterium]
MKPYAIALTVPALVLAGCAGDAPDTNPPADSSAMRLDVRLTSGWLDPLTKGKSTPSSPSVRAAYDPSRQRVVFASFGCSVAEGAALEGEVVTLRLRLHHEICPAIISPSTFVIDLRGAERPPTRLNVSEADVNGGNPVPTTYEIG